MLRNSTRKRSAGLLVSVAILAFTVGASIAAEATTKAKSKTTKTKTTKQTAKPKKGAYVLSIQGSYHYGKNDPSKDAVEDGTVAVDGIRVAPSGPVGFPIGSGEGKITATLAYPTCTTPQTATVKVTANVIHRPDLGASNGAVGLAVGGVVTEVAPAPPSPPGSMCGMLMLGIGGQTAITIAGGLDAKATGLVLEVGVPKRVVGETAQMRWDLTFLLRAG